MPEFEIRNPKILKQLLKILLAVNVVLTAFVVGLIIFKVFSPMWIIVDVLPYIAVAFGFYVDKKEKFVLKDGEFKYVKIFRKSQSIKIEEIERVDIVHSLIGKVIFYDKQGNKKLYFLDDGTAADNPIFLNALMQLNIDVRHF